MFVDIKGGSMWEIKLMRNPPDQKYLNDHEICKFYSVEFLWISTLKLGKPQTNLLGIYRLSKYFGHDQYLAYLVLMS